jgi:hypothetical protein
MPEKPPMRPYYSRRVGSRVGVQYDLATAKRLFAASFEELQRSGYFDQAFGSGCRSDPDYAGTFGRDVGAEFLRRTGKDHLWPFHYDGLDGFDEEDLFDTIEVLHDAIAQPDVGTRFECGDSFCSGHYRAFDGPAGQQRLRDELNPTLERYGAGYRLTEDGQIARLADEGLQPLEDAQLPDTVDPNNVRAKVEEAKRRFRHYHASEADRHAAIRTLADVLEYLRPQLKLVLASRDEADLFNLANNFGIRHNNAKQKTDYDKHVWYRWIFYYYLATIHAVTRLIEKADKARGLPHSPTDADPTAATES